MAGLSTETIDAYYLAWTCFKTLYAPSESAATRQLAQPNREIWVAIAQLYNTQRCRQLSASMPEGNPERLEQWLKICAKRARVFLYPTTTSLNLEKSESGAGELLDDLPDPIGASPSQSCCFRKNFSSDRLNRVRLAKF